MLKYVEGDICLSSAQAIAHGVAPNDDFKNGLALSLRESWPAMYKDFRHYCKTTNPKPGTIWTWSGPGGVRIISLFTQEGTPSHHGGKPEAATLPNVGHCLKALRKECETLGLKSLALPRLATGVGRLAWENVAPLVEEYLGQLKVPVYVYSTYHQGVKADEARRAGEV